MDVDVDVTVGTQRPCPAGAFGRPSGRRVPRWTPAADGVTMEGPRESAPCPLPRTGRHEGAGPMAGRFPGCRQARIPENHRAPSGNGRGCLRRPLRPAPVVAQCPGPPEGKD
ncbi:hypothetical protein GCM10010371_07790 [Streptomyces subrutilus]|uniref:Uncharacterized protein n=1 Tax=Streptomyces subrutilus TaxID=36818 RepID=A0A918V0X4_9ACTN|nr:hypothetical protein GCM10010371_07790 [Streptomyces subrutilus]